MSLNQFLSILKARWAIGFSVLILTVATTVGISMVIPKQYSATSSVVVDVKSPDPISGIVLPGMISPGYMATQVDIIQSDRVAQSVINALRLTDNPTIRQEWQNATKGQGDLGSWLAELILKNLEVKPSKESNVINIAYTAVDPGFAAAIANAFVKSYIDVTIELRVEPAKQYATLFEGQAKALRERVEAAQSKLSSYQKDNGLIATDERLDIENARLNELSTQLVVVQSQFAESRSRKANAGDSSQEVLNNSVVSALQAELTRLEAKSKELTAKYGLAHPLVSEQQASIDEFKQRLAIESQKVTKSVGINNTVNASREADLKVALDAQRQKLLKLKEQRDEAAVLLNDVSVAQRQYDQLQARLSQTSLESQSNLTNVSILKRATPPSRATSPKIILNTIISILLGSLLALAITFIIELLNRKIRSNDDISISLEIPILGNITQAITLKSDARYDKDAQKHLASSPQPRKLTNSSV
jgi:succinoglycan biosynthesis transport protein ExoP